MKVELREISPENFRECINLSVGAEQKSFVAENVYSIAQASLYDSYNVRAVYAGEDMVGFVMFGLDPDDGRYYLGRLMIDHKFQGNGCGKAAVHEVINSLRKNKDCSAIFLSVGPGNEKALKLYEDLGFVRTGEISDGEIVMRLDVKTINNAL